MKSIAHFPKRILLLCFRIMPFVFFILLLGIALILYDDYGGFTDEILEIQTAAVNAKYILSKFPAWFANTEISVPIIGKLQNMPDLLSYDDRTYGTAVMMPSIFINQIPGVELNAAQFLNFRRFYTFLNFYFAMIAFFILLKIRFKNALIALTGTIMLMLTPRFFAESFYNCKDIVFFSWVMVCLCGIGWYMMKNSRWGLVLFCFGFAFAANTRLAGFFLWPAFLIISGLNHWIRKIRNPNIIRSWLLALIVSLLLFYAVTPYLWGSPTTRLSEGIRFSSSQITDRETELLTEANLKPLGQAELFLGNYVDTKQIWYYLPVWMGITIPVFYILLFLAACFGIGRSVLPAIRKRKFSADLLFDWFCLAFFLTGLIGIILLKMNLYNGWRHAYFLYAPFIYLAVLGFQALLSMPVKNHVLRTCKNAALLCMMLYSFFSTGSWVLRNHPLDFVYFNEIGRNYAQQFSRDYWGVASKNCILDLLKEFNGRRISLDLNADYTWGSIEYSLMRLPQKEQDKFDPVWKTENAEYLCYSYKNTPGNQHSIPDFEMIKTYAIDGYDVAAIYKRVRNFKWPGAE